MRKAPRKGDEGTLDHHHRLREKGGGGAERNTLKFLAEELPSLRLTWSRNHRSGNRSKAQQRRN